MLSYKRSLLKFIDINCTLEYVSPRQFAVSHAVIYLPTPQDNSCNIKSTLPSNELNFPGVFYFSCCC